MPRKKKIKDSQPAPAVPAPPRKHDGPCIVAALVWLAVVAYSLVVVQNIFNADMYKNLPAPIRAKMSWPEIVFSEFQLARGTFILSIFGIGGCAVAYAKRSVRGANIMICAGIFALIVLISGTFLGTP